MLLIIKSSVNLPCVIFISFLQKPQHPQNPRQMFVILSFISPLTQPCQKQIKIYFKHSDLWNWEGKGTGRALRSLPTQTTPGLSNSTFAHGKLCPSLKPFLGKDWRGRQQDEDQEKISWLWILICWMNNLQALGHRMRTRSLQPREGQLQELDLNYQWLTGWNHQWITG